MEVITIETKAFQLLLEKIDAIHAVMQSNQNPRDQFMHQWLDSNDVMKMLGISRRTLCNYVRQGKLKASRIGKRSYLKVQEVKDVLCEYRSERISEI